MPNAGQRETILEFRVSGSFGFVNAIDVETGIEVSITVPAHTAKADRENLALRRLMKTLTDLGHVAAPDPIRSSTENENGGTPRGLPPSDKRGLIA
jgi:hypothetical protein